MDRIEGLLEEIDQFERYEECIEILNQLTDPGHFFESDSKDDLKTNVEDWIQKLVNIFTKKYISKVLELKNKIASQEDELEELHYEYSIIKDENDQLATFCSSLSSEIGLLKKFLQEADNSTKTLREEICNLRMENRSSVCTINELERDNKRLIEKMMEMNKKLTSEKAYENESIKVLAQEKEVLQDVIARQTKMIERLSQIEKSNLDLQNLVDELKVENSKLTRMEYEQQELHNTYNQMIEMRDNKENLEESPEKIRRTSILSPRSAEFNHIFNKKLAGISDHSVALDSAREGHTKTLTSFISPRSIHGKSKFPLNLTYRFASEASKKKYIRIGPLLSDNADSEDPKENLPSECMYSEESDRTDNRPSLMTELLESGNDPNLVLNLENVNVFQFDPNTSLKHTPTYRAVSIIEFENKRYTEPKESPRVLRIEERRFPVSDFFKRQKEEGEQIDKVSTTDPDETIMSKDSDVQKAERFVDDEIDNAREATRFSFTIFTTIPVYGLMAGISFISTTKELIRDAMPWFLV